MDTTSLREPWESLLQAASNAPTILPGPNQPRSPPFDFDGQVRFEEPETGEYVDADPQAIRAAYLEELRQFIADYRRECQNVRADFVSVDNAMTFDKALLEFLMQRQTRF